MHVADAARHAHHLTPGHGHNQVVGWIFKKCTHQLWTYIMIKDVAIQVIEKWGKLTIVEAVRPNVEGIFSERCFEVQAAPFFFEYTFSIRLFLWEHHSQRPNFFAPWCDGRHLKHQGAIGALRQRTPPTPFLIIRHFIYMAYHEIPHEIGTQ